VNAALRVSVVVIDGGLFSLVVADACRLLKISRRQRGPLRAGGRAHFLCGALSHPVLNPIKLRHTSSVSYAQRRCRQQACSCYTEHAVSYPAVDGVRRPGDVMVITYHHHHHHHHFYRAMLCIRGTSRGPVSVCHKSVFYRNG